MDAWYPERSRGEWPAEVGSYAINFSFGGRLQGRLHHDHPPHRKNWVAHREKVPAIAAAARGLRTSNLDYRTVLAAAGGWAVYADPPYGSSSGYIANLGDGGMDELCGLLERQPLALLSGYADRWQPGPGWERLPTPRKVRREMAGPFASRYGDEALWVWRAG